MKVVFYMASLFVTIKSHNTPVSAPWEIPAHEAHSFLTSPTRFKRSDPACNTVESYCESNKASCMQNFEQSREYYCGLGHHSCSSTQTCFLATPCPHHFVLGCSDDQCLSFPCHNGATCQDTNSNYNCQCVPGWDPATDCRTDYDECRSVPCMNGGSCNNLFNNFSCNCSGRYEGDICEKDCRPGPADIVFVVDTSGSVENDYNKSIELINKFITNVSIGSDDFQIGVITYNFVPEVLFDLNDHTSAADMFEDLLAIKGQEAATLTAPALQKAAEMLNSNSTGGRSGVAKYIILLSDGLASDRNDAVNTAASIISKNVRILTVGFGNSISHKEMMMLSRRKYDTFSLPHFDDLLNRMFKETVHTDCTDCSLQTGTDLLILLDTSKNQTINGYNDRLITTRKIIESVLSYNPTARIGMMSYSDEPEQVFALSWSTDKDKLIAAALQVNKESLKYEASTSHALEHVRKNSPFSSRRKIILLLSNGNWKDKDQIKHEIELLDRERVEVTGALAGDDCIIDNYSDVVKDPSLLYYVQVEDGDWTSIESFASMTTYYECTDDIFISRQ